MVDVGRFGWFGDVDAGRFDGEGEEGGEAGWW